MTSDPSIRSIRSAKRSGESGTTGSPRRLNRTRLRLARNRTPAVVPDHDLVLVLGAGGTVGLAYEIGTLYALWSVGGFDATLADLIIGTSAGSVVGAYLRVGWTVEDLWRLITGPGLTPPLAGDTSLWKAMFTPMWGSPLELARRSFGSAYVVGRSLLPLPAFRAPRRIGHAFPGGMFRMVSLELRLSAELNDAWPGRPLWLCAFDIDKRRRVVLGGPKLPEPSLVQSVLASCAIPGLYRPVRLAGQTLVDGGVHSSTNLDLVADRPDAVVVAIAPMTCDPTLPATTIRHLGRRSAVRAVMQEAATVRARGSEVLVIHPGPEDLKIQGRNLMKPSALGAAGRSIARTAYEQTARALDEVIIELPSAAVNRDNQHKRAA